MVPVTRLGRLALFTLLVVPLAAFVHPGHTHKIHGTVTAVTASSVEVLDRNNEKTTFGITKETRIRVGQAAGSWP